MDRSALPFVRVRLSVMMFLFFFAIGSWAVTLSTYLMSAPTKGGLNFTTNEVGWVYSTFAFGGMLAPLVVGLLADRLFAAQRVLGVTGLICSVLLFAAGKWCDANFPRAEAAYHRATAGEPILDAPALERVNNTTEVRHTAAETFRPLFGLMLAYCISLQIGNTLTTVIALRNLPDPGGFSRVRLYGTVGWIVAGYSIGQFLSAVSSQPLYLAAGASGLQGLFAFLLPHTPPKGVGRTPAELFGLPALTLFRDRSFGIFVGVTFTCAAMNQFYAIYAHRYLTDLGIPKPEQVMTVGQLCEVGCMFIIPVLRPNHRIKGLMLLGLIGWVVRGAVMTWGHTAAVLAVGVPMHGWSYAFYYIVAATYLDREAPPHLRASVQGIITFVSSGIGVWAGNIFASSIVDHHRTGMVIDWRPVWLVPMIGSAVGLVVFALFFQPPPERKTL